MKILKGQLLRIKDIRKGVFDGVAIRDFDTEVDVFYPIKLVSECVEGLTRDWVSGDAIPCRNSLCQISILEEK